MSDGDVAGTKGCIWSAGTTDLFSSREISLLIELVEALPVLYAADKKQYKGIIPREKAWKIISEKLNRTVTECEKKWRYLRDKYVKERRRLIDESKSIGREAKSNWQHYESMEFLSTHLRLPINGSGRSSSLPLDDDELQHYSEDSPPSNILSPQNTADVSMTTPKVELDNRQNSLNSWSMPSDIDKPRADQSEQFKPLAPPPHYPGLLSRAPAPPAFAHHPLWAMWSNSLAQAQAQQHQHIQNLSNGERQPTASASIPSPAVSELAGCNDTESEPSAKRQKRGAQDVNINVSLKDLVVPAEKYSEYHFCISLAQMMESVPMNHRADLKIKLIQMVTSSYPRKERLSEGPPSI
ncbi:uncharacterized protein [Watersipora subatra]|uniref:uncharacterized protein n=1 Tax=Watersipora subatra TaxID=2589382 RepID=UPI00355AF074